MYLARYGTCSSGVSGSVPPFETGELEESDVEQLNTENNKTIGNKIKNFFIVKAFYEKYPSLSRFLKSAFTILFFSIFL